MSRSTLKVAWVMIAVLGTTFVGSQALAQPRTPQTGAEKAGGRSSRTRPPPLAHFVAEGVGEFTLDRSSDRPLIQFSGSQEILVLTPAPGPRGDINFKNDIGQTVLRISGLGGVTVFTSRRPAGAPAELVGMADPLATRNIRDAGQLAMIMGAGARRIGQALGRNSLLIEAPDVGPESATLVADSVIALTAAFERDAAQLKTEDRIKGLRRILILEGDQPSVQFQGTTLTVVVAARMGIAGRPSSERIALAIR